MRYTPLKCWVRGVSVYVDLVWLQCRRHQKKSGVWARRIGSIVGRLMWQRGSQVDIWWLGGSFVHEVGVGVMVFSLLGAVHQDFLRGWWVMVRNGHVAWDQTVPRGQWQWWRGWGPCSFCIVFWWHLHHVEGVESLHIRPSLPCLWCKRLLSALSVIAVRMSSLRVDRSWGYVWAQWCWYLHQWWCRGSSGRMMGQERKIFWRLHRRVRVEMK